MSDIFEVIKNRRSVRAYKDEQIEDDGIAQSNSSNNSGGKH